MTGQVDLAMVREGHPRAIELACQELEVARLVVAEARRYARTLQTADLEQFIADYDTVIAGKVATR